MIRRLFFSLVPTSLAFAILGACSSENSSPSADPKGSCSAIASACHAYDKESSIGHECHELGHDGDDTKCAPRRAECVAACPPKEEGHSTGDDGGDAGAAGDGSTDAAPDPVCTAYCECLDATCKSEQGYPFGAPGACLSACASMSTEETTCYPKWCAKAKTSGSGHDCQHAWGKLGLVECDTL